MPDVNSQPELLIDCLQDLFANEQVTLDRMQDVIDHATDPELKEALSRHIEETREQARRLRDLAEAEGSDVEGPECLWATAILKDAGRDAEMVESGPLLDIALVGAVRKLEVSEIVSYETAIAVAGALRRSDAVDALKRTREEELRFDARLASILERLAGSPRV